MDVEFAFLANAASVPDGNLNVLGGGVEAYGFPSFPGTFKRLVLVAQLHVTPAETREPHTLVVELWNERNTKVAIVGSAQVTVPPNPLFPKKSSRLNAVFDLDGSEVPRAGEYECRILIDGQHYKTVPLTVLTRRL